MVVSDVLEIWRAVRHTSVAQFSGKPKEAGLRVLRRHVVDNMVVGSVRGVGGHLWYAMLKTLIDHETE